MKLAEHLLHGRLAEKKACKFLQKKGLTLVTKNFLSPYGEIDLIMQNKQLLVFVEVRSRSNEELISALETISPIKCRKIIKTATFYLQQQKLLSRIDCRFDIVTYQLKSGKIDWIQSAFDTTI